MPFSPVHKARKFSAVFGATSFRSSIIARPTETFKTKNRFFAHFYLQFYLCKITYFQTYLNIQKHNRISWINWTLSLCHSVFYTSSITKYSELLLFYQITMFTNVKYRQLTCFNYFQLLLLMYLQKKMRRVKFVLFVEKFDLTISEEPIFCLCIFCQRLSLCHFSRRLFTIPLHSLRISLTLRVEWFKSLLTVVITPQKNVQSKPFEFESLVSSILWNIMNSSLFWFFLWIYSSDNYDINKIKSA